MSGHSGEQGFQPFLIPQPPVRKPGEWPGVGDILRLRQTDVQVATIMQMAAMDGRPVTWEQMLTQMVLCLSERCKRLLVALVDSAQREPVPSIVVPGKESQKETS